jgi:sugar phosphate isomerase/epimerase
MARAGIQTIIFGPRNREDIGGVLREVASIGFAGAETGNLFRQEGDPTKVARLFQETGLALCGCHAGYAEYEAAESLRENIRYARDCGSRYLMCSGVGDRSRGLDAYRNASRLFNEVGQRCRDAGLQFCYHNHAWEFEDREGDTCGMDVLAAETDAALVKFCIDVYWVHIGGADPAAFIHRHAERGVYYHFKDGRRGTDGKPVFTELGGGEVDLEAAFAAAASTNPEWIVYEQDRSDQPPAAAARASRAYMRERLGI